MVLRKIIGKIHLWLGMLSGLVVFIIALTGCFYAFQAEIQDLTQPYRFVKPGNTPVLPPSRIIRAANEALPDKQMHAIMYEGPDRSAKAIYWSFEDDYYYFVYVDPYLGEVLKVKNENLDFFRIILDGHFYLWLPPDIGQPVVATATLLFVIMLISGLFLWWPRNKNGKKQRFSIKWGAGWRRKNYDLHSVTGFYILLLSLIFALTGLVWGFEWFRNSVYSMASGGEKFVEYYNPQSDISREKAARMPAIDRVWLKMVADYPDAEWIEIHPPEDSLSSIAANANPDASTYWKIDYRYFDQYSLEELQVDHIWNRYGEASVADKIMRLNYDIHVGAVLGLPGKIFAFLTGLLIASLPFTGVLLWYGKKNKNHSRKSNAPFEKKKAVVF
jgi:uncharacterized iron-regulated membrane protein